MNPELSIVIPCRNEDKYIAACLESILSNEFPKEKMEILVIDGMSQDGTRNIVQNYIKEHNFIHLLDNPEKITPCALNIGIRHAQGKIIMRLDAHNVYPPNYISSLVSWLEKSGADNVGGVCRTKPANETPKAQAIALALSHPFGVGNSYFRIGSPEPRWVDTVPFGCYRREVFDRIGLFDEELVRNQDDELNLRLLKQGGKILLVPEIVSEYHARDSLAKLWRMYWQYGYFKPLVAKKVKGILTIRQLMPALFILSLFIPGLAGFWFGPAGKLWAGIIGSYLTADLFFSGRAGSGFSFRTKLWLSLAFPVMHFSYGLGYLQGMLDFWLSKRRNCQNQMLMPLSR